MPDRRVEAKWGKAGLPHWFVPSGNAPSPQLSWGLSADLSDTIIFKDLFTSCFTYNCSKGNVRAFTSRKGRKGDEAVTNQQCLTL